jgi:hypothetical protein
LSQESSQTWSLGWKGSSRAADAALLDPCDEHRDEGRRGCGLPARFIASQVDHSLAYSQVKVVVAAHPQALIPVLVTGIQPGQVLGLERLLRAARP